MNNEYGNLFIVAAPSGAGKTSLVNSLVQTVENLELSISYTTRPPRAGEKNGVDYFFVTESVFIEMLQAKQFLEYATVYDYHYGTSTDYVLSRLKAGVDVLLEIDWQGAKQIRESFEKAVSIFILPPSISILKERLYKRRQDEEKVILQRLSKACEEMAHYPEFDYLLVNDQFDETLASLIYIVRAQRLRCDYQKQKLSKLLTELLQSQ